MRFSVPRKCHMPRRPLADAASQFTDPGEAPLAALAVDPALAATYERLYSSVPALIGSLDSVASLFSRTVRSR